MRKKTVQNPTCRALFFNWFVHFIFGIKKATWNTRGPGPGVRGALSPGVENTGCGGKKLGVTGFVSEIRRVQNLSHFHKLLRVIHHGLQGF